MKKTVSPLLYLGIFTLLIVSSCKKNDYITGGVPENVNMYKNTSTYDVLAKNALYDTLIKVINAAGIKDKINAQGSTFFAPSDYSIYNYLATRTYVLQNTVNQNAQFGLDSLLYYVSNNINGTRDSLSLYLIPQLLTYNILTQTGAYYNTGLAGDKVIVSYELTKDPNQGYNPVVSGYPRLVYFTQMWYPYDLSDDNPAGKVPLNIGVHTLVTSSGLQTQNGIIHSLTNSHVLFFYGTKQ
ncbi:MAG: hypothetical protein ABIP30_15480 [Ferruginibacter sp.]